MNVNKTSFSIIVSFLCLALVGAIVLPMLTVRLQPIQYNPSLTVSFSLPNSSARVVEMEVTSKLEGLLARMKGVRGVSSTSQNGRGNIRVTLDKHANIENLRLEASSIVRQTWKDLPDGTSYPRVTVNTPKDQNQRPFLTYTIHAAESPARIQRYVEEYIQPTLSRMEGVYQVKVSGATPMEWRLTYNPHQLEALGISWRDIQEAVSAYYGTAFIGKVETHEEGWCQLAIMPETYIGEQLPLDRMFVKKRDGKLLAVSELVDALHVEAAPQSYFRINGLNSIYLSITAEEDANQLTLGEEIKRVMASLEENMPEEYEVHIGYDATEYIGQELEKIYFRSGVTVLILLVFVLLMTRRWKYTLLVVTSLVVNLLIAVVIYYFAGIDIQLYTLAGITISLNLIIDNTIVMTDHILHRRNLKVYLSILAATLTTICALGVVLFMDEGLRAKLMDFSIVLIINLAVSLVTALFFVPAMMQKLRMTRESKDARLEMKKRSRYAVCFTHGYEKMIGFVCRHKVWACVILVLSFGLPVFLLPEKMEDDEGWHKWYNATLGSEYYREEIRPIVNVALGGTWRLFVEKVYEGSYFDEKHETVLHVSATLPNGSTLEQMNTLVGRMEAYLKRYDDIKQFHAQVHSAYQASIDIYFPEEHQYSSFPYQLKAELTSRALELGGGSWSIYGLEDQGFNNDVRETAGSYRVKLKGYNYDQLNEYAEALKDTLLAHRRVRDVQIGAQFKWYKDDYREFLFDVSTERLAEVDITPMKLYNSMRGIFARDILLATHRSAEGVNEHIRLSSAQASRYDTWQLSYRPLQNGDKEFKLYSLADIGITPQAAEVRKNNQQYELCLQYEYVGAYMMGTKMLKRTLEEFNEQLPAGYEAYAETGGRRWSEKDNGQYLLLLLIAVVIFFVTSILFNSLRKPFAILFVIPVSFVGVFLTFWLFELNFDQGGFAAMILLCGITVNAAIYLLDEYGNIRKSKPCMPPVRAYLKAWNVKIVPILLTVLSTLLGFIPFIVGPTKEAFWFPLAAATMGGLIMSLVALFFFLPAFVLRYTSRS
ncbi:MAG: efflux RND transporter permease subunit [Bacteroidaceae bacterium]|nr:efflux RND transporter permease subunit [Bacteroidaceae bacterium]